MRRLNRVGKLDGLVEGAYNPTTFLRVLGQLCSSLNFARVGFGALENMLFYYFRAVI